MFHYAIPHCSVFLFSLHALFRRYRLVYPLRVSAGDSPFCGSGDQVRFRKIASVGDSEFSLEVPGNQTSSTLQFQIDGSTQVEGTLAVGSQATVDYHTAGGKMIATHVVITPTSGVGLY
jgi:hypothetical protein